LEFTMNLLEQLFHLLTGWWRPQQAVRRHTRQQAYGPCWSRHRLRRISGYNRNVARRSRW
jgi:hypothetical protein